MTDQPPMKIIRYTPFETGQMLDIPDSTLRRLARQYSEFLSPQRGRKRMYTSRDIEILRLAREMLGKGSTVQQVREHLKTEVEKIIDLEEDQETPAENTALAPIFRQLTDLNQQYTAITGQQLQDRARLERLEKWFRLPWWKRLFTTPPEE